MKSVQESEVSLSKGRSPHLVLSTNPVECEHENPPHPRRSLSPLKPHCPVLLFDQPFTIRFLKSEKKSGYTSLPEGCNVPEFSKHTEHKRTQLRWAVSGNLSNALLYEINDMTAAAKSHSINSSTWQKAYFFNIFKTKDRQSRLSYWRLDLALWTWTHWTVSPLHSKLLVIGTVRGQQTLDSSVLLFSLTSKVLHLNKSLLRSRRNLILTYALSQTSYDILGKYMGRVF